MRKFLKYLLLTSLALLSQTDVLAISGSWRGNLEAFGTKIPLVLKLDKTNDGKTVASMDSPNQNAKDIPCEVCLCTEDSISLDCKIIGATYTGRIYPGRIEGVFTQAGMRLPLVLTPEAALSERRPQTPVAPFPYTETDTVFFSADGTRLAGTLTIPERASDKAVPVVVMITGSGPQNRDEEVFEHRPFAVIADWLARHGIASFRYDDRGVASSGGNYAEATIDTFKSDAAAALQFVRHYGGFGKAGLLGHSEGGTLAVLIAAEDAPDFIISLAGVSVPAKDVVISQNISLFDMLGVTDSQRDASARLLDILFDTIKTQYIAGCPAPIDIDAICRDNSLDVPDFILASVKRNMSARNAYFDSLVSLDPTSCLKKIKCPVLVVNGTKDTQVNAEVNLESFRKNVKDVDIRRIDNLNHLMQHASTGKAEEYADIKETVSPEVLEIISDFILRHR
ncbi:MAG: alpha/beta hydrolase [Muribaculaceae bacterium]|nr:alpha/beta hydrolase [Muribaculaceae bacterium]